MKKKFGIFRRFVEKISKDESFTDISVINQNPRSIEQLEEQNPNRNELNTKQDRKIAFERNPLNFIYPEFIVKNFYKSK